MDVFRLLDGLSLMLVVKVLVVTLLGVYTIFALLMMRQIVAMTRAVQMQDDYLIRGLGGLHFIFACIVLVIALLVGT